MGVKLGLSHTKQRIEIKGVCKHSAEEIIWT
jgi:hypothetical protein